MEHCRELHEAVAVDCKIDDARRLTADRSAPSCRFIQPALKLIGPPDIVSDARRERISKNRDPKFLPSACAVDSRIGRRVPTDSCANGCTKVNPSRL